MGTKLINTFIITVTQHDLGVSHGPGPGPSISLLRAPQTFLTKDMGNPRPSEFHLVPVSQNS